MVQATRSTPVNYWPQNACARAFWSQHQAPPYHKLLRHTLAWLEPRRGQRWLDLGCGCGQLSRALWEKSGGSLAEVVAMDCAQANSEVIARLAADLSAGNRLRFVCADFSNGLRTWPDGAFHGVVSGLAIQYAESFSEERGCWTDEAYDRVLADVYRVLAGGGQFVFSVNVPEPSWWKLGLRSVPGFFRARNPARFLKNSLGMIRYGSWLKQQARAGRFHYLSAETVTAKLAAIGFTAIEHRHSYAGQAYVFRCRRS